MALMQKYCLSVDVVTVKLMTLAQVIGVTFYPGCSHGLCNTGLTQVKHVIVCTGLRNMRLTQVTHVILCTGLRNTRLTQ